MAVAHDLYRLLGVGRTATSAEIRAAYLELLKRHHPDLADAPNEVGRSNYVATLNLAFATLRDPRKRAEYDAQLRFRERPKAIPTGGQAAGRPSVVPPVSAAPGHSPLARFAVTFGATMLALLVAGQIVGGTPLAERLGLGTAGASERADRHAPLAIKISDAERARLVRAAAKMSLEESIVASRRCFRDAVNQHQAAGVLGCITFDDAVLMLAARDEHRNALPAYFRFDLTRNRHLDAIARWTSDSSSLLETVSALTLRTLLREIRSATVSEPPPPVIVTEGPGDLSDPPPNPETGQKQTDTFQLTQSKLDLATQGEVQ